MEWFTWGDLVSILGVGAVAAKLWDRAVKEAVANERRFTRVEARVEQGREADQRHEAQLKELRENLSKILDTLSELKVLVHEKR